MGDRTPPNTRLAACDRDHRRLLNTMDAISASLIAVQEARTAVERHDAWADLENQFRAAAIYAGTAAMHARGGAEALTPTTAEAAPAPKHPGDLALVGGTDVEQDAEAGSWR